MDLYLYSKGWPSHQPELRPRSRNSCLWRAFKALGLCFPILSSPATERRADGHQRPPKPFQQRPNAPRGPAAPSPQLPSRSHQLLPTNPLPRSHPLQRQEVDGSLHKDNTIITCAGIWKDCLRIQQKVRGFLVVACQDRAQQASHAPTASFKHHCRGSTSPAFSAAAQPQTVLC